ncbi:conserved hypothetical protein [Leishmania braziliensis MHOM/BR/75/M2904]|uniref:Uncharacterized protein n=3 Tax=Viannia TaxID=37616 RepID=A4HQ03_LEIBR|nr:conserved hypothetical protein [Leishmania braziliensis MHOM/BR/75/M2904]KAI5691545.1 hypothetical protein MNV84_08267 [Leishmania braziliensis]CAJ2481962.1 unnamed protein product [Leishmania braziliensis]CAJ2482361.1 unnamed protein product [Leishmania braziliensis]CAM44263.1 conserved hypothetical protein [Leishmania braziliensis MHOM/BR/75/M2904]SYZ70341.1 hypothetical_protein [Leishmania braziliensis MHOM/BR/75/M2904]
MSLLALNVCLISSAFDVVALPLSSTLCPVEVNDDVEDTSLCYGLAPLTEKSRKGYGYAHCTVMQLCARALDLKAVREIVRETWLKFRKHVLESKESLVLTGVADGPIFATTEDGRAVRLPNITVERTPDLIWLHETIVRELDQYRVKVGSEDVARSAFHRKFPADNNSATSEWMLSFTSQYSHENYAPHITLGACTEKNVAAFSLLQKTEISWRECRLVVSHMGNFCSCFELLES